MSFISIIDFVAESLEKEIIKSKSFDFQPKNEVDYIPPWPVRLGTSYEDS